MGCPPHSDVLVCEIKVHAVLKGHYVDTLAVSVVLQEELLEEEEGSFVRNSLTHLYNCVPLTCEVLVLGSGLVVFGLDFCSILVLFI